MSEDHPLSLVEQVTPIIDLMARTSSHFARLRDFVTLKFPPGFPVKIGILQFYDFYLFIYLLLFSSLEILDLQKHSDTLSVVTLVSHVALSFRDSPVSCA